MKTALLISTYNWPEALELVLKSLENQTIKPTEVLIADDGSADATKSLIETFKKQSSVLIKHIWHEDNGFKRSEILNKAIAQTDCDYIIQLDGDCIMHSKFIQDHITNVKQNQYLFGSRVNIRQDFLTKLFSSKNIHFGIFSNGIKKRTRNIHSRLLGSFYKPTNALSKKLRGCNLSFWREDFIKINGYNEDMTGWGREDSEMVIRLLNSGILGKRLRYMAIIYHIWHNEKSRERLNINDEIQQTAIREKLLRCKNGIDKYL
ncbi:MAG: glycosyltransferase family 2 protein [Flavobacteriaceae bacterium]